MLLTRQQAVLNPNPDYPIKVIVISDLPLSATPWAKHNAYNLRQTTGTMYNSVKTLIDGRVTSESVSLDRAWFNEAVNGELACVLYIQIDATQNPTFIQNPGAVDTIRILDKEKAPYYLCGYFSRRTAATWPRDYQAYYKNNLFSRIRMGKFWKFLPLIERPEDHNSDPDPGYR